MVSGRLRVLPERKIVWKRKTLDWVEGLPNRDPGSRSRASVR